MSVEILIDEQAHKHVEGFQLLGVPASQTLHFVVVIFLVILVIFGSIGRGVVLT